MEEAVVIPPEDDFFSDGPAGDERAVYLRYFLDLACTRGHSPEAIGRWILFLAYQSRTPSAPKTQRELAARTGLSVARVNKLLHEILMKLSQNTPGSERPEQG